MNRSERFHRIDQLLAAHGGMSRQNLLDELEISWATLKRDLAYLKNYFNAPIIFDHDSGKYRFDTPAIGPKYELPGLWFNGDEAHALLTMHQLLSDLEPGLLAPHVTPLLSRLEAIVGKDGESFAEAANRIRLARIGMRRSNPMHFAVVSRATLTRKRIQVRHYNRTTNQHSDRELSPQRLVYYRNNWYLETWCHVRNEPRRFSVDALEQVVLLNSPAKAMSAAKLDAAFVGSYGVFGGEPDNQAVLRFSSDAARWVADEEWHPNQIGQLEKDGSYTLKVPYADPTELIMDVLRHGHHVEVISPAVLRQSVRDSLKETLSRYDYR